MGGRVAVDVGVFFQGSRYGEPPLKLEVEVEVFPHGEQTQSEGTTPLHVRAQNNEISM